jgi:TonB-linked SusC/RagA family outer membrane protein
MKFSNDHLGGHSPNLRKIISIAKLTILAIAFFSLNISASVYSQKTKLSLDVRNKSVKEVLYQIENLSEFRFICESDKIDLDKKISLNLKDQVLETILSRIFENENVTYEFTESNLVLIYPAAHNPSNASKLASIPQQATRTLSGIVTDERNEPIVGANVVVKGTTNGVITDVDGKFTLSGIPENAILLVSYIGYADPEIAVGNRATLSVVLKEDTQILDEVVVVGYGTQKRRDLTGSVASVSSDRLKDLPMAQIDQALGGKLAGVHVLTVSGEPGADALIRVRGVGSISASSNPLYVVDGFPVTNLQMLNPNDIETIDVLKDASATAIYGSRGANGVVLISTKRGQESKAKVSVDIYTGWQSAMMRLEFFNSQQQAQYYFDGIRNQNIDNGNDVSLPYAQWPIAMPQTPIDVLEGRNKHDVDALDAVLQTAPQTRYQLSVSGGNKTMKYAISGEYLNQDGIIIATGFKRYSVRSNFDIEISPNFSLKFNLNNSMTDVNYARNSDGGGGNNWSVIAQAGSAMPYYPLYEEDGSYFVSNNLDASTVLYNPIAVAREAKTLRNRRSTLGNFNANYVITKDLNVNLMAGVTLVDNKESVFRPSLPVFFNNPAFGSDNTSHLLNWITETTFNYNKDYKNHNFKGLLGFTSQKETYKSASLESNRYPNNFVESLSAVSGIITNGTSTISEWSLVSYLGRFNYNYAQKYYLTLSLRTDGSSRFGSEKKYGIFPSAAIAWRISDDFFKEAKFLDQLKLKLSYGETGNNNIGDYEHLASINYIRYILGNAAAPGYAPARMSNPFLTWEKQRQLNTGIDASFLKNRINITIDYFASTNSDLLLNVNIPDITGFNTALQNIGEVENKGWEFVINTVNLNKKFIWTTDFNLSTYRNKVTKLGPTGDPIKSNRNITMIGQPIGMFYGLIVDGIFNNQAEVDRGPVYNPGLADHSRPGDIRFKDISGPNGVPDGIITSDDYTIIGSPYPDFYYGMTNRFSYKDVGLEFSIQGSHGNEIYNIANEIRLLTRSRSRTLANQIDYWKSDAAPGDGNTPRPNNQPTGGIRLPNQRYIDSGSYLRISNISLSYRFPRNIIQRLQLGSLRLYATAVNPFIITSNTSFNPEVYNSRNALQPGIDYNNYPVAKSLILGINAEF